MITPQLRHPLQLKRREALQIGVGLFGLSLPGFLRAAASGTKSDVSCIFIFLAGGASQFETFDPKPQAPVEIRGLWNPTQTNVPGTYICEKLPLLARCIDKVSIIRSWQGKDGGHAATLRFACGCPIHEPAGLPRRGFRCVQDQG